ncbi:hypothetical protein [Natronococcus wangiae]|uniref:hypothetical protein n=1 Tax=Natronococcus wangiae TaxID=3068275 RepID=UPI00273F1275|nr:hypothetical protein [Natronococcus sp. AD5]
MRTNSTQVKGSSDRIAGSRESTAGARGETVVRTPESDPFTDRNRDRMGGR